MCAIAGIIGPPLPGTLEAMLAVQHHRGPDDRGSESFAEGRVQLGHNRLSIVDLSPAGHQPMSTEDGRLSIVFNGEIYNFRELRNSLPDTRFTSGTDTEVILAAYRRWGEDCLERLVGMFAFAIWDEAKQRLFCARDRLGVKPFHYTVRDGRLLFASEIKGLLAAGVPASPDMDCWANYLVHGEYEPSGGSFFDGIKALPAAHAMTVDLDGRTTLRRYWDLAALSAELISPSDDEAATAVHERLSEAVRLRLRADVPVGINLSGGLDSAAVVSTADAELPAGGVIETFTGNFGDPAYDETEFAAAVAKRSRWQRNTVPLTPEDVPAETERAVWHQEGPFGGISTLMYQNVHRAARAKGLIVMLEGQGGDELFAGYDYFRAHHFRDLLDAGGGKAVLAEARASGAAAIPWLRAARNLDTGRGERRYYDGSAFLRTDCIAPELHQAAAAPRFPTPFADNLRNALYRDLCQTKLPRVLRMTDRLSMAHSVELRQPLIDHRLVELAFRLPASQKIRGGVAKRVLRKAIARQVPASVRNATKRFVVTPQREWLRGPLAEFVSDIIGSRPFRERGLFEPAAVQRQWQAFRDGGADNAFFVWQWVNTELWFQRFCDSAHAARPAMAVQA